MYAWVLLFLKTVVGGPSGFQHDVSICTVHAAHKVAEGCQTLPKCGLRWAAMHRRGSKVGRR